MRSMACSFVDEAVLMKLCRAITTNLGDLYGKIFGRQCCH